ncbi:MAG: hypothetical protein MUE98_01485, partial [Rhodobacteraceae bacterium]|nr:hypothetical protein [Paracoccaceae bacterium]
RKAQLMSGTVFSDRGVSFDEILHAGRLGGSRAILTYIEARRAQFVRQLSAAPAGSEFQRRCHAVHEAFVVAESLVRRSIAATADAKAAANAKAAREGSP